MRLWWYLVVAVVVGTTLLFTLSPHHTGQKLETLKL